MFLLLFWREIEADRQVRGTCLLLGGCAIHHPLLDLAPQLGPHRSVLLLEIGEPFDVGGLLSIDAVHGFAVDRRLGPAVLGDVALGKRDQPVTETSNRLILRYVIPAR